MVYVFLGPPGAGKGTQGDLLSEKVHLPKLVTGDMFREEVSKGTELGREVQEIMQAGKLVSDEIVLRLVKERMRSEEYTPGCVFDGFPRTIDQAEALERLLEKEGKKIDLVFNIIASDEELVKRLSGRRICQDCQKLYNIYFNPPAQEDCCGACGGRLIQRKDDTEQTILERLAVYKNKTSPLIEFYNKRSVLREISGSGAIEEVFKRVLSRLERG